MTNTMIDSWPSGSRDTTEFPKVEIDIGVSFRNHLHAFCSMDGIPWNDYHAQGQIMDTSDSRLRTYRKMYERLGLVYRENELLRLSRLGKELVALEDELKVQKERVLLKPMATAISILSRYQLRNPIDGPELPVTCDILPCICIWKAMLRLENKLHFEEVNRVILRVPEMSALDAAIERIRQYREQHSSYDNADVLNQILGEPVHTDQVSARIAPWFSFAGWGGLVIEQQNADDGYRHLVPTAVDLVQQAVACPPSYYDAADGDDWLRYYIGDAAEHAGDEVGVNEAILTGNSIPRVANGENVLLYGVPGSGKSWTIAREYCSDETRMERLVFHPDYTYSDFVGQIMPKVEEGAVSYRFVPGPFTKLLKRAYENPGIEYFLVIEEINRGNAPAIFGEVFQLLDRKAEPDASGYPVGTSEYGITNENVASIVYGDPDRLVRIPSNMSIIGTMNTSDQNVFTLDTAFQRRWNMRLIENTFEGHRFADNHILDTDVSWRQFCEAINREILKSNVRMTSSEDKRLGAFFITAADLVFDAEEDNENATESARIRARRDNRRFAEKVIKYLWDDAFKFSRENVFETNSFISLEQLIREFMDRRGNERFRIFKEGMFNAIVDQVDGTTIQ